MVVSNNNIINAADFFEFAFAYDCILEFDFIPPLGNATDSWEAIGLNAREKLKYPVLSTL